MVEPLQLILRGQNSKDPVQVHILVNVGNQETWIYDSFQVLFKIIKFNNEVQVYFINQDKVITVQLNDINIHRVQLIKLNVFLQLPINNLVEADFVVQQKLS